jgi:hypothetical protein
VISLLLAAELEINMPTSILRTYCDVEWYSQRRSEYGASLIFIVVDAKVKRIIGTRLMLNSR